MLICSLSVIFLLKPNQEKNDPQYLPFQQHLVQLSYITTSVCTVFHVVLVTSTSGGGVWHSSSHTGGDFKVDLWTIPAFQAKPWYFRNPNQVIAVP